MGESDNSLLKRDLVLRGSLRELLEFAISSLEQGSPDRTIEVCSQVLDHRPNTPDAIHVLGLAQLAKGEWDLAQESIRKAIDLAPQNAIYHCNLGIAYFRSKQFSKARTALEASLQLDEEQPRAWKWLGDVQDRLSQKQLAVESYRKSLQFSPEQANTWNNLGATLYDLGRSDEAVCCFRKAIGLKADVAGAIANLAHALLRSGCFQEGWQLFESRETNIPEFEHARWQGEDLQGQTLFIAGEQGLGDKLQFCRYAMLLKERFPNCNIIFSCTERLLSILSSVAAIDRLVTHYSAAKDCDYWIPMMSLPLALQSFTEVSIPNFGPYIKADEQRVASWRKKLESIPGFRIGVCWQGNFEYSKDRHRSFPLSELQPIATLPGVSLVSLQHGNGVEQLHPFAENWPIADLGADLDQDGAFIDTAAVIANLDLVVTCDSALAHLAGAMGTPVWIALSGSADWRWLDGRNESPWYPTLRLFRQKSLGDWRPVFEAMASNLRERAHPTQSAKPVVDTPPTIEDALSLHKNGSLEQAARIYKQISAIAPQFADPHHLLGILRQSQKRTTEAVAHVREAIALKPSEPVFHVTLGKLLSQNGQHVDAIAAFRRAAQLAPQDADVWLRLGLSLGANNEWASAQEAFEMSTRLDKSNSCAWLNLGKALISNEQDAILQRRFSEERLRRGLEYLLRSDELGPPLGEEDLHLASSAANVLQMHDLVSQLLSRVLAHNNTKDDDATQALDVSQSKTQQASTPVEAQLKHARGLAALQAGQIGEAEILFRESIALCENDSAVWVNLGITLIKQKKFEDALAVLEHASQIAPNSADAWCNLGFVYDHYLQKKRAVECYRKSINANPRHAQAHVNLGEALHDLGRLPEAIEVLEKVVGFDKENKEAKGNLAVAYLSAKDFRRGWPMFEVRHQLVAPKFFPNKRWNGEDLAKKSILLVVEQGIGDSIQFVRYAKLLKGKFHCRIGLHCPQKLHLLLNSITEIGQFLSSSSEANSFDYWVPMMSLPLILEQFAVSEFPSYVPYIAASDKRIQKVDSYLLKDGEKAIKIGVCWQGNRAFLKDRMRSFPLEAMSVIADLPGVKLFSLQKGDGCAQIPKVDFQIETPELDEDGHLFMDTAAWVSRLDIVISCDSAVAHLAAAMGCKTWIPLSVAADWRWGTEDEQSWWYPTVKLFRQTELGHWEPVFEAIANEIEANSEKKNDDT